MTSRLTAAALALGFALATLPALRAQPEAAPEVDTSVFPVAKGAWDLRAMSADPVKLLKVSYDRDTKQAKFLLEFTRDLTVRDTDWTGVRAEPPYRFQFEDAEGVTLMSLEGKYDGVPVGRKGRRLRVVVHLPSSSEERERDMAALLPLTKKVVVDFKPYGS